MLLASLNDQNYVTVHKERRLFRGIIIYYKYAIWNQVLFPRGFDMARGEAKPWRAISHPRKQNEVPYIAYIPYYYIRYIYIYIYTIYTIYRNSLLLTAFLLLSAILYFMRMSITPSKAHAYRLLVHNCTACIGWKSEWTGNSLHLYQMSADTLYRVYTATGNRARVVPC